ncbi:hypothetical protein EON65_43590 [archaeon]|nr:MAG: hypothetical protein EON65_43590 [archaeon]
MYELQGIELKGFWMSEWYAQATVQQKEDMFAHIGQQVKDLKLSFFYELHDLDDFAHALSRSQEPFRFRKVLLQMQYPDRMQQHDQLDDQAYEVFQATQYL